MIKSKNIVYPAVLVLAVLVPLLRYYVSTPGDNDCMREYVKNMEFSDYKGYIYSINGAYHIEPANSSSVESLEDKKIGEADGCIMSSGDFFRDINNTVYCSLTYFINKSPIDDKIKEPLALMKGEAIYNFNL